MKNEATESDALLSTRRWLMIAGTCVWITTTLLIVQYQWTELSEIEQVLVLCGSALLFAAVALAIVMASRQSKFLWLFPIGQVCFILCAFVASDTSPNWLALTTLSSWLGYFLIALSSRRVGLLFIPIAALVTIAGWTSKPNVVVPGALEVFGGWVVFIQLLGGSTALWWAWNSLRIEARDGDLRTVNLESETIYSIAMQERAGHWRKAATHIHESVLNTLRYVLASQNLDRKRLKDELAYVTFGRSTLAKNSGSSTRALAEEVLGSRFESGVVTLVGNIADIPLTGEVFETLRAALVELMRNIDRHSEDKEIALSMTINDQDLLTITLVGGTQKNVNDPPGIGRSTVLGSSLNAIGASLYSGVDENGRPKSSIVVSLSDATSSSPGIQVVGFLPFDKARLLVTAPIATMSLLGSVYFLRTMWLGAGVAEWSAWLGLFGVAIAAVVVVKRRHVRPMVGVAIVLIPALVPSLLVENQFECADSGSIAPLLTISGYSVMIIAAWSGRLAGIIGLAIWAYGGLGLVLRFPSNCRDSVSLALLNSLVVLPIILIVSFIGAKAYRNAADRTRAMRQLEVIERSRAQAADDLNAQLDQAVSTALRELELVADGGEMTDQVRHQLEVQDGRIRSVIQVDPERDGAFAVLMRTLVEEVAELGIRANVKGMVSSHDARPIDSQVDRLLSMLFLANRSNATQVQVFTDGVEDHLVLTVSRSSLRAVGLSPGEHQDLGEIRLQVELGDESIDSAGSYAVILSRKIAVSTK